MYDDQQFERIVSDFITDIIHAGISDTNGIMMAMMEWILRNMIVVGNIDVFMILSQKFQIGENGKWHTKQEKNAMF